jgi:hypothetical protein
VFGNCRKISYLSPPCTHRTKIVFFQQNAIYGGYFYNKEHKKIIFSGKLSVKNREIGEKLGKNQEKSEFCTN